MLQVVSGGSILAALAQLTAIQQISGMLTFLIFVSGMASALILSIVSAYWRHQYKMWDIKNDEDKAKWYLGWMRRLMHTSVVLVVASILWLIVSFWVSTLKGA